MKGYLFLFFSLFFSLTVTAQEWEQVSSLPNAFNQTHHSFAFSFDTLGYIVGGSSPTGYRDDFYQYDPTADEWTQLDDFPGGARSFAIGDTWDGKAYFGFGSDGDNYQNDLWVFDPFDMSWTQLADCPCEPRLHPALIAHNDKIFVGMGNNPSNFNDWWEYDITTDAWIQRPDFPGQPRHHPFQFGIDEYIYTGFGHGSGFISFNWYRYDPITTGWEQMANLPAEGRVAGTQFSYEGKGFVLSGDGDNHDSMLSGEFWMYDPLLDNWTEFPPHPSSSRWAPSSFIINDEVYIINGQTFGEYVSDVYKFSLDVVTTPPIAGFTADETDGCSPFTVNYSSTDSENVINYEWSFPGGTPSSSTNANPTITYQAQGIYDASLIVSNVVGMDMQVESEYISVTELPDVVFNFTQNGLEVAFENNSTGGVSFSWDFGDGNDSSDPSPNHVYYEDGTYLVVLSVTNECGTSTFEQEVIIDITSVEDLSEIQRFELFPNPNDGRFTILLDGSAGLYDELQLELYNIVGQKLYENFANFQTGSLQQEVDLENLTKGIYFFRVSVGDQTLVKQLIVY